MGLSRSSCCRPYVVARGEVGGKREHPETRERNGVFGKKTWRLPTLPHQFRCSTIGATSLNFSVRNGKRCVPRAVVTKIVCQRMAACRTVEVVRALSCAEPSPRHGDAVIVEIEEDEMHRVSRTGWSVLLQKIKKNKVSPRTISTSQLHTLPCVHLKPINPVISRGPY